MTTITLRIPVDVVNSLKEIAPQRGFSGYQGLLKAYLSETASRATGGRNAEPIGAAGAVRGVVPHPAAGVRDVLNSRRRCCTGRAGSR